MFIQRLHHTTLLWFYDGLSIMCSWLGQGNGVSEEAHSVRHEGGSPVFPSTNKNQTNKKVIQCKTEIKKPENPESEGDDEKLETKKKHPYPAFIFGRYLAVPAWEGVTIDDSGGGAG